MNAESELALQLDDIQAGALQPRPTPYAGIHLGLRIDDAGDGRELLRRLVPLLDSVADFDSRKQRSLGVALTFPGLAALGVPSKWLKSFPSQFPQGMAARAPFLRDVGENAPEHWEKPFGTGEIHMVICGLAPDANVLQPARVLSDDAMRDLPGIAVVSHQEVSAGSNSYNWFGFRDSISQPTIEGSGIESTNPLEVPFKAGEFVLGYRDETGSAVRTPEPSVLGRNGTYVAFRKLHMRVAAFRQYVHDQAQDAEGREWVAAKMVGRWPSGALLSLCPHADDAELGADPARNEDEGADRGLPFAFVGAHLDRQFVQKQWIDDGRFIGAPQEKDPLVAGNDGGKFTIPNEPIRRRLRGLPAFLVNRGGEYGFMPSLRALRWLADLET